MEYTVKLFMDTQFTKEDIPDTPALLERSATGTITITGNWDLQDLYLNRIRVNVAWNDAKHVDYIKIGDAYYYCTPKMINNNVCDFSLQLDALTTLGGATELTYRNGWIERAHPNANDDTNPDPTNENVGLVHRPKVVKHTVKANGARPNFYVSTLDLYQDIGDDGKPVNGKAIEYPGIIDGEEKPVLYLPPAPPTADGVLFSLGTGLGNYDCKSFGLYLSESEKVKKNVNYIIGLGLQGSLLYSYSPILFDGGWNGGGKVISLTGGTKQGQFDIVDAASSLIKYKKAYLTGAKIVMTCATSGDTRELPLFATTSRQPGKNIFEYIITSDPHPNGKLYLRPKNYYNLQTTGIGEQGICSHEWIKNPITASGVNSIIESNQQKMQVMQHEVDNMQKFEYAQAAIDNKDYNYESFGDFIDTIGNNFDKAFYEIFRKGTMDDKKRLQSKNAEYAKIALAGHMNSVEVPFVSCAHASGLGVYDVDLFTIYAIIPSDEDIIRLNEYFDQYGYALNKKFDKSYLTNRSNFNYIKANNVMVTGTLDWSSGFQAGLVPSQLIEVAKAQLNQGVRIWHKKPNSYISDSIIQA